jgi:hypothetical protein
VSLLIKGAVSLLIKGADGGIFCDEVVGYVAHLGERRKVYRVLVGKHKGRRPFGRLRHRWEDGIRMDLREIG